MTTTYASLKADVRTWLSKASSDLVVTDAVLSTYVRLCEAELSRELRVHDLQNTATLSSVIASSTIDLPSDFRSVLSLTYSGDDYEIVYLPTFNELRRKYNSALGKPDGYAIRGNKILFNCPADEVYTLSLDYYGSVPALSDTATTNAILLKHPDVYLYGCLKQAQLHIKDEGALAAYSSAFVDIIRRIKLDDGMAKTPAGSQLRPQRVI